MPTATVSLLTKPDRPLVSSDAGIFVVRAVVASLGFFGLLRLPWVEAHLLLPMTRAQAVVAGWLFGPPASQVDVTLACSGSDALALCAAAIVAYPAAWRSRLAGAAVGIAFILILNTVRIGTLGVAAASPAWFTTMHIYVWPALLTTAIAGYVYAWMRLADRHTALPSIPRPSRRFVLLSVVFLLVFAAVSPLYVNSSGSVLVTAFIARSAALILSVTGVAAHAASSVLWTSRGGFLVTQECLATPLIPVYLAAICSQVRSWRWLALGLLAVVPLFTLLGILRLLLVAVPATMLASPLFLVHAFYQLLLGAVVVWVAARWRHAHTRAVSHAAAGITTGLLFVLFLGAGFTRLVTYPSAEFNEGPQGALMFLLPFQAGLYLALWVAAFAAVSWRRMLGGLALLGLSQAVGLLLLHAWATQAQLMTNVPLIRAWAVAGPVLFAGAVVASVRARS